MSELNRLSNQLFSKRQAMRPTARTWIKHVILLLITFITCTIAGVIQPFGIHPPLENFNPQTFTELSQTISTLPLIYLQMIYEVSRLILTDSFYRFFGLSFSVSVLFILICHEMGHYIACRIYGVDATLPFFIPTPPLIGPAGTLGAFIKIVSPIPSRKAVFDIGVAGPIAGFIALLPIAVVAVLTTNSVAAANAPSINNDLQIVFSDPLLYHIFAYVGGVDLNRAMQPNPFYAATWLGLLITALNLIPSGQLDGGHAVYAVFGKKFHKWSSRIAFLVMLLFSVLGFYFYSSPSGLLFLIVLGIMLRVGHPEPYDESPLDTKRLIIAFLTFVIFVFCFVPFPIKLI